MLDYSNIKYFSARPELHFYAMLELSNDKREGKSTSLSQDLQDSL